MPGHHTQATSPGGLRIKHNPGLFQYPSIHLFVVHAQQIQRAADVVLFAHALRRVPLNLRTDSAGDIQPLAQAGKSTA